MEKRTIQPVPALGRVQLRRHPDESEGLPPPRRQVLVAEADDAVREAMSRLLPAEYFDTAAFADGEAAYRHAREHHVDLALVDRELPRVPGTRLCELIRASDGGANVGLVLVSPAYSDPYVGAGDCATYGADAFLPLPASQELVQLRIGAALARREPIERLDLLPVEKARAIDSLFANLEVLNYYELLRIETDADPTAIKLAFHQRSLVLHPDRYARLRQSSPHAYDRINTIYKRVIEAYRVLSEEGLRARYNLGLQQRGDLRLQKTRASRREEKELALCRTDAARGLVAQSLELRSVGELEASEVPMAEACNLEPDNTELAAVLGAIRKLLDIMHRG